MPARAVTERAAATVCSGRARPPTTAARATGTRSAGVAASLPGAPGKLLAHGSIHLGRALALAAAPAERRPGRGSAYTITLRKVPTPAA